MASNSTGGLYPDHRETVNIVLRISSGLSIAGALFIIVSHILFSDLRKFSRKLIAYVAVADIGAAVAWMASSFLTMPSDDLVGNTLAGGWSTVGCFVQGLALQFFMLSSALWTSCFAFHLYLVIWCYNKVNDPTRMECTYRVIAWCLPLLTVAYLVVVKFVHTTSHISIGPGAERPWCWIENDGVGTFHNPRWADVAGSAEQFALFYAPAFVAFVTNVIIYTFLFFKVHEVYFFSSQHEDQYADEREELQRAKRERAMNWRVRRRLLLYLGVFIATASFGFAGRVYQLAMAIAHSTEVSAQPPPLWLIYVDAGLGPLQGCLNALVYGVNPQLCQQYSNKLRVICARICGRGGIAEGGEGGGDYLLRNPQDDDYESGGGSYPAASVDMNRASAFVRVWSRLFSLSLCALVRPSAPPLPRRWRAQRFPRPPPRARAVPVRGGSERTPLTHSPRTLPSSSFPRRPLCRLGDVRRRRKCVSFRKQQRVVVVLHASEQLHHSLWCRFLRAGGRRWAERDVRSRLTQ